MADTVLLSKQRPAEKSKDYAFLRAEGIKYIQQLAGDTWTDHNIHDPGITILEVLCFAITELGYKTHLDFNDLLASSEKYAAQDFFLPSEILPSHPVTIEDFRKVIMDLPSIKNAWVSLALDVDPVFYFNETDTTQEHSYEPGSGTRISPSGLYDVLLEFQDEAMNSNIVSFPFTITFNAQIIPHTVEIAFPHWDDERIAGWKRSIQIVRVCGLTDPLNPSLCNPIQLIPFGEGDESDYYADLTISHDDNGIVTTDHFGVTVKITSLVGDPGELPLIEAAIVAQLGFDPALPETLPDTRVIKQYNNRVAATHITVEEVVRHVRGYRNVCEDFYRFRAIRIQEIALKADIEITSGTDVEELLAEIFYKVYRFLSPAIRFYTLEEMLEKKIPLEKIMEGPLLQSGFIEEEELRELDGLQAKPVIYTSDLMNLIMSLQQPQAVTGQSMLPSQRIVAVENLSISNYVNNRVIKDGVINCLRLVNTELYKPRLSLAKSRVSFYREEIAVPCDMQRVMERVEEMLASDSTSAVEAGHIDLPKGQSLNVEDYYSIQNELPRTYRIGPGGVPSVATPLRKGQARQLKAYLLFFEQLLANYLAQLNHINSLFSIQTNEERTYFPASLYEVPGIQSMLKAFDEGTGDWPAFIADANNAYIQKLKALSETEEVFVDRRNRFLDHLMARFGEELVEYSLLVLGEKQGATPAEVAAFQNLRKRSLVRDKAAFLQACPALSAERNKGTAFSVTLRRSAIAIVETDIGGGVIKFAWELRNEAGATILEGAASYSTSGEASAAAERAADFATNPEHYEVTSILGSSSFNLLDGPVGTTATILASAAEVFSSIPEAEDAIAAIAGFMRNVWDTFDLSGFEKRVIHKTGLKSLKRRNLFRGIDDYFEIAEVDIVNPATELRFTLRDEQGAALMISADIFPDQAAAGAAIEEVIERGILEHAYAVVDVGGGNFIFQLNSEDGTALTESDLTFSSESEARAAVLATMAFLHLQYSGEGFHLVEHILLRPQIEGNFGDEFLALHDASGNLVADPYSFRLSLFFPSGYIRDFSTDPIGNPVPVRPGRFRDADFRRFVEKTARKECLAHVQPDIYWLDRDSSGTADAPSFDNIEQAYKNWIEAQATYQLDPADLLTARRELVLTMNRIADSLLSS